MTAGGTSEQRFTISSHTPGNRLGVNSAGFTIIEVLIVLAVTALMAVAAMVIINGRQNRTEFQVAITGEKQTLEQIINETNNGFYPNGGTFKCTGNDVGFPPTLTAGSVAQGANGGTNGSGCVFLGKVVTFGVPDDSTSVLYPLFGNQQYNDSGARRDVQSFKEANPQAAGPATGPNLSSSTVSQNGLTLYGAKYTYANGTVYTSASSGDNATATFALAYDLHQYSVGSKGLNSATQSLDLFGYDGAKDWVRPLSITQMNQNLNPQTATAPLKIQDNTDKATKLDHIDLCFASGTTNQSGLITISGNGQLSVTLTVMDGTQC